MAKLEVESKFELTEAEFESIRNAWKVRGCRRQLNVYYDLGWRLAELSATLRIRFDEDATPVLTLKVPVSANGAKRTMCEFEVPISEHWRTERGSARPKSLDVQNDLPGNLAGPLEALGVSCLARVGWVRNTRLEVDADGSGVIELDRLELPDGSTFLEAEIETNSQEQHELLTRKLAELAPHARPSRLSKFQRFRAAASV